MSEDVYVLKRKLNSIDLQKLNKNPYESNTRKIFAVLNVAGNIDRIEISQVEDWIAALKSGKKIVNPLSPKEEFRRSLGHLCGLANSVGGEYLQLKNEILEVVRIIAKEHPDVGEWLKEDDPNA
ncbi:hypothetical protein [Sporolactobacillus terrae]|uniref:hypothetical protein n=1 Tax=Sporolactobacillus terrae TaxID=269673 RepID=UPI001CC11C51|nr:hypothetical protein [Sporolactobacillus terrae]UAK17581.1 hypothetical protein K7399_06550 [Sporolactobacillus terrae]